MWSSFSPLEEMPFSSSMMEESLWLAEMREVFSPSERTIELFLIASQSLSLLSSQKTWMVKRLWIFRLLIIVWSLGLKMERSIIQECISSQDLNLSQPKWRWSQFLLLTIQLELFLKMEKSLIWMTVWSRVIWKKGKFLRTETPWLRMQPL